MDIALATPTEKQMQSIAAYIQEYELDNRHLQNQEFTIALRNETIVGFGRLRKHSNCTELCSLGVITPLRRKGIGKKIVAELIRKAESELFLVCIIPEYFYPFGFKMVQTYPDALKDKMNFCSTQLLVPETYCVMRYSK